MPNKSTPSRRLSQPRKKREVKPLTPFDNDPPPPHLSESLKSYNLDGPNNPFSSGIDERDHLIPMDEISRLALGDFPSWSALNMILLAIIEANPSKQADEQERLERARAALLGYAKRGRQELDDQAMLEAMGNQYATLKFLKGIEEPETEALITAVLDTSLWPDRREGGADHESWKAVRKRLRLKFEANRNLYLAAETAANHPEQKRRWAVAMQIISLLGELGLVTPVKQTVTRQATK